MRAKVQRNVGEAPSIMSTAWDSIIKSWPVIILVISGIYHAETRLDRAEYDIQYIKGTMQEIRGDIKALNEHIKQNTK